MKKNLNIDRTVNNELQEALHELGHVRYDLLVQGDGEYLEDEAALTLDDGVAVGHDFEDAGDQLRVVVDDLRQQVRRQLRHCDARRFPDESGKKGEEIVCEKSRK